MKSVLYDVLRLNDRDGGRSQVTLGFSLFHTNCEARS